MYIIGSDRTLLYTDKIMAVVGTRKMTSYGEKMTAKLAKGLVEAGYVIVSGMALGIDAVAHWTAINNGGKTIAVLGAGADVIYPPENRGLYFKILATGGAIVSEIPLGQRVEKNMFAARNRIISGLAQGVVIIEGEIRSGSLITARLALDQGRDVFAVPGSLGTDYLIDQGAKAVICVDDILCEWI
ncbi:MAG: DNA-processing protein DprA [Patescibacteria group bacterium]